MSEVDDMVAKMRGTCMPAKYADTMEAQAEQIESLTVEVQQKEAKRRALWDALVSAYKREGCGLGEAQILADVVMDSASDRPTTEREETPTDNDKCGGILPSGNAD